MVRTRLRESERSFCSGLSFLSTGSLGEGLEGAAFVGLFDQLDEGEDVAVALAAEAVPGLRLGVDGEAGGVLLVKGAQAHEVLVAPGQAEVLLDDLDEVDLGLDLGEGVIGRRGGHARLLSNSPGC
jgi:hypothetical protein